MGITSQITAPTLVQVGGARNGVCVYDNGAVTNNNNPSAYVIFADSTWAQVPRATLTAIAGVATGSAAFSSFEGAGQGSSSVGPGN
jgi:hypothetical protein